MSTPSLSSLLNDINITHYSESLSSEDYRDLHIEGIYYDSRRVRPGSLFFAVPGDHTDGHQFIDSAIRNGARAVVYSNPATTPDARAVFLRVDSVRRALSCAANAFYDRPSDRVRCIGVTGTDGKSTTVYFIYQLLRSLGFRAGLISTVSVDTGGGASKNPFRQSTPEAPEIHAILSEMVSNRCDFAVVEATSHGLSEKTYRLEDVNWFGAVMTNLGHEHLEFHGSLERYRSDKCRLFSAVRAGWWNAEVLPTEVPPEASTETPEASTETPEASDDEARHRGIPFAILNGDDASAPFFREAASIQTTSVGSIAADVDVRIAGMEETSGTTRFGIESAEYSGRCTLTIPGHYNAYNAVAAMWAAHYATGCAVAEIAELLPGLRPPTGRMDEVKCGQPFRVVIDFAHTPGSFELVLPMIRRTTSGRLIVLFGSAGERDTRKRKMQGRVADGIADIIVLADEDPRYEPSVKILEEIASACTEHARGHDLFLIPDRKEAIRAALELAASDDTVLLLGKGHESSILYDGFSVEWSERDVTIDLLEEMGYTNG